MSKALSPHEQSTDEMMLLSPYAMRIVRPQSMHSVFLYHAVKAGMDMGIVNAGMLQIYDDIEEKLLKIVEDAVNNKHDGATEALLDAAEVRPSRSRLDLAQHPVIRPIRPDFISTVDVARSNARCTRQTRAFDNHMTATSFATQS